MEHRIWHDNYHSSIPSSIDYPQLPLKTHFFNRVCENPDADYIVFEGSSLSYQECNDEACRLASALLASGYQKQDSIALMMDNIPHYIIALQTCFKLGARCVPTNPRYPTKDLHSLFIRAQVKTVIVSSLYSGKAKSILQSEETELCQVIIVADRNPDTDDCETRVTCWKDFTVSQPTTEPNIVTGPNDIAFLQPSGGTTGIPKLCALTQKSIEAIAYMTYYWFRPPLENDTIRALAPLPLYHVMGYNNNVGLVLIGGGTIILVNKPTAENLIENINRYEPNYFTAVPMMLISLLHYPPARLSKLRGIPGMAVGGTALPQELQREFEKVFNLDIKQGYGLSEAVALCCTPYLMEQRKGSVGIPYPDTDVLVVDTSDGKTPMPPGVPGELIVKGPQVMKGYWNNKEENSRVFKDGWFYTGDIVTQDKKGYLTIVNRMKDLIISNGFNVYPREIEEAIVAMSAVQEVCCIGIPDERKGEACKAYIVKQSGRDIQKADIVKFCKENLARYKVPTEIEFVDEIPKTAVGKPDCIALRARHHGQTTEET